MSVPKIAIQARIWGLERVEKEHRLVFDEAIQAGYAGAECRAALLEEQEESFSRFANSKDFSVIALHTNLKAFDIDDRQRVLGELLERMNRAGTTFLVASMGRISEYGKWFELAARITEQCARNQVQFCYHNHAGEFENGLRFFDELTNSYHVALAADLAWVHRAGVNVEQFIDRYASHIKYVHVKDTKGEQWKELGEGEIELKPILQRLLTLNLPWWTVEQDSTDREPIISATMSRQYLKNQFGF